MHVGDIERTVVTFTKGQPTEVCAHKHSTWETRDWADVSKLGKHPIVYNAAGTHATYFGPGIHGL